MLAFKQSLRNGLDKAVGSLVSWFMPEISLIYRIARCRWIAVAAMLILNSVAGARTLDLPPADAFTIVVIPDTQGYHGINTRATPKSREALTNPVLVNHVRWIRENIAAQHIVFVSHVGDIVDRCNPAQWTLARDLLDQLPEAVPLGLVVGNHDVLTEPSGDTTLFQRMFPAERFRRFSWYGGTYTPHLAVDHFEGNNANSFQLFSAGGLDFVFLHLECNAPDEVLQWADDVLDRYHARRALVSTHMDLGVREKPQGEEGFISDPKGRMEWSKCHGARGNSPMQMWDKLYRKHPNLDFIFSGDQSRVTAMRLYQSGEHGNLVHALLSDYMSAGPLRLYRFIPHENRVQVIAFDTTKRELVERMPFVPARTEHQFSIPYTMTIDGHVLPPSS